MKEHRTNTNTPNSQFFRILLRIKMLEVDPIVEKQKFLELPKEYEGLRESVMAFIYPQGVDGPTRFCRFDDAGYPLFFHQGTLNLQTPKGFVRIAEVVRH